MVDETDAVTAPELATEPSLKAMGTTTSVVSWSSDLFVSWP